MEIGVDLNGAKDILGMLISESESSKFWLSVLNELKNCGTQEIFIVSVDNLTGFSEAIRASSQETEIQRCSVHQVRNSVRYVSCEVRSVEVDSCSV